MTEPNTSSRGRALTKSTKLKELLQPASSTKAKPKARKPRKKSNRTELEQLRKEALDDDEESASEEVEVAAVIATATATRLEQPNAKSKKQKPAKSTKAQKQAAIVDLGGSLGAESAGAAPGGSDVKAKKAKPRFSWPAGVELETLEHEICRQLTVHNFLAAPHGQKSKVFNQLYSSICPVDGNSMFLSNGKMPSDKIVMKKAEELVAERQQEWMQAEEDGDFGQWEEEDYVDGVDGDVGEKHVNWTALAADWLDPLWANSLSDTDSVLFKDRSGCVGIDEHLDHLDVVLVEKFKMLYEKQCKAENRDIMQAQAAQHAALLQHQTMQTHEKKGRRGSKRKGAPVTQADGSGGGGASLGLNDQLKVAHLEKAKLTPVKLDIRRMEAENRKKELENESQRLAVAGRKDEALMSLMMKMSDVMAKFAPAPAAS